MQSDGIVRFRRFRLDPVGESLWRGRKAVPLSPKVFAALAFLVDRAGRLVTKDELRQAIWDDPLASDASIKVCIAELRKALGDPSHTPTIIETVHRRGYRFIAPLIAGSDDSPDDAASPRPVSKDLGQLTLLVGRDVELAQLDEYLDQALRGRRQMVFVSGEPGIGKTALVQAFLDRVNDRGAACSAVGQCMVQYIPGGAYRPIFEVLTRLLQGSGRDRLNSSLKHYAPMWSGQLPFRAGTPSSPTLEEGLLNGPSAASPAIQSHMLHELGDALTAFAADTPLVVVFEDLQAGDFATLELISLLARRQERAKLMIVGVYCPADDSRVGCRLKLLKQDLQSHGKCSNLPLSLLRKEAVAEYLEKRYPAHSFPRETASWIQQRTEGNPLYMIRLLQQMQDLAIVVNTEGRWRLSQPLPDDAAHMPGSVRSLVAEQISQLDADDRRLMAAAAMQGTRFDAAALACVLGLDAKAIECRLQALEADYGLVQAISKSHPDGTVTRGYRFVHLMHKFAVLAAL
jgi:DNA-binding winged helix-turn-helix (wHTH) protein